MFWMCENVIEDLLPGSLNNSMVFRKYYGQADQEVREGDGKRGRINLSCLQRNQAPNVLFYRNFSVWMSDIFSTFERWDVLLTKVLLVSQAIARPMSIVDELSTPSVSLKRGVVIICGKRERVDIGMGLLGNWEKCNTSYNSYMLKETVLIPFGFTL